MFNKNVIEKTKKIFERVDRNKPFKNTKSLSLNIIKSGLAVLIFKVLFWYSTVVASVTLIVFTIFGFNKIIKGTVDNSNPFNQTINVFFNRFKIWFYGLPLVFFVLVLLTNSEWPLMKIKEAFEELSNTPTSSRLASILYSIPLLMYNPASWIISELGDLFLMDKRMFKRLIVFWLIIVFLFFVRFPLI